MTTSLGEASGVGDIGEGAVVLGDDATRVVHFDIVGVTDGAAAVLLSVFACRLELWPHEKPWDLVVGVDLAVRMGL